MSLQDKQHFEIQPSYYGQQITNQQKQIDQLSHQNSDIPYECNSNNNSIINELNLLENNCHFESRVIKIESFIYAEQVNQKTPFARLNDSYFEDENGQSIPPITQYQFIPKDKKGQAIENYRITFSPKKFGNKIQAQNQFGHLKNKKSVHEEILRQNQLLQKRLLAKGSPFRNRNDILESDKYQMMDKKYPILGNKDKMEKFKIENNKIEQKLQKQDLSATRLQEQYNKSKVLKLYNFILQGLPICKICKAECLFIKRSSNSIVFTCRNEHQQKQSNIESSSYHPFMGLLFDLENKHKFEQQSKIYQQIIDQIEKQIGALQKQIDQLVNLQQKINQLKNLNRRKYKEINESKYFIKKYLEVSNYKMIPECLKILPRQYIEQMEYWQKIRKLNITKYQNLSEKIYQLMPIYLKNNGKCKLENNISKILNYDKKQQNVKICISENIKFPLKNLQKATFIVDGGYNLTIFQKIDYLKLQFQNKKTLRELSMLFTCLPQQIYSLSFNYNHKLHSHISAENFGFLSTIAPIESLKKINITIQNVKEFEDLHKMVSLMKPKLEFIVSVTKNVYSKKELILPNNFYNDLLKNLGQHIVKFEIKLPENCDSAAKVDFSKLINGSHPFLTIFLLDQSQKKNRRKTNILDELDEEKNIKLKKEEIIFKKLIANRIQLVRIGRSKIGQLLMSERQVMKQILSMIT